jgi:gliding motility-associated-like protein
MKRFIAGLVLVLSLVCKVSDAQVCSSGLGDPIVDVTFGSGTDSFGPPLSSSITPMTYLQTTCPQGSDLGGYSIVHAPGYNCFTGDWVNFTSDHTGDPNGYFMLINASTPPSNFYKQEVDGLCSGTSYQFSAWVVNMASHYGEINPDITFSIEQTDGTVIQSFDTGPVPIENPAQWNQYAFYFTTPPGITSVVISMHNNAPGGYGNDLGLDDITFRTSGPTIGIGINGQPGNSVNVCPNVGSPVGFTGTLGSCYASNAFQWQQSTDQGGSWTDIPGAVSASYSVLPSSPGSYLYRLTAAQAGNIGNNQCRVASNDVIVNANVPNTAFAFVQQACDPLQVLLTGTAAPGLSYTWAIDGATAPAADPTVPSLLYTFPDYGTHAVTLSSSGAGSCASTTSENIPLALTPTNIIQTADTGICIGKSVPLSTLGGLGFCWSPTIGLDDPTSAHPTATPTVTTKYHFTSLITGNNLILNGDFSAGNTDFTSAYLFAANGSPPGVYSVGPNSGAWLPGSPSCTDHTSGTGNMLLVNGAQQTGVGVWSETVTVTPNTNYAFSAWLDNITTVNPAILQFSINGQPLGNPLTANATPCVWNQFYTDWNSGSATTAIISIVNENTGYSGNDFALDDISFAAVNMQTDSVTIDVETPTVTATPAASTVCPGVVAPLQAGGALTYSWSPATGLNDPTIANPGSLLPNSPSGSTVTYTVTGTTARGCLATATSTVTALPETLTLGPADSLICNGGQAQLYAGGGNTYSWTPAAPLTDPASPTPIATLTNSTEFYLSAVDANNCQERDSLFIGIRPIPVYTAPPNETVCAGFGIKLGGQNGPGYVYSWSPDAGLDNPSAPSPIASPAQTMSYTLDISDSTCPGYDSSFTLEVTVRPSPVVTANKDNDIDCSVHSAQLQADGALYYNWSPATGLNSPTSRTPVATIDSTTTYMVKGTGSNGCYAYDSVTVAVTATGANTFVVPNAFTPNGDGHNDCFGVQRWGDVQLEEMVIYNRWGLCVFSTQNPSGCWDGTFHGQPQPAGAYPYVIRAHTYCGEITRQGVVMLIR